MIGGERNEGGELREAPSPRVPRLRGPRDLSSQGRAGGEMRQGWWLYPLSFLSLFSSVSCGGGA